MIKRFLYRTFQKIMSLRAAALALWRRGNLFLSETSLKIGDCFGKKHLAMTFAR
jgi:hypothetical protein